MGDFLIDLRPSSCRSLAKVVERLRFSEDTRSFVLDQPDFGVVVTYTGEPSLWSPFRAADGTVVAVVGRAAFDEAEWKGGESANGNGGLAAKVVYERYRRLGIEGVQQVSGNCVLIVVDVARCVCYLVADCCGAFPAFQTVGLPHPLFGSHPDVLASSSDEAHRLDEVSLAEFLITSSVTPPYTYYERIRALDHGSTVRMRLNAEATRVSHHRYFEFTYRGDGSATEEDLAEELAVAFRRAVRRRTLPRLGLSAVALSGGLDSRALLACVENKEQTFAFTCYNEPNQELQIAEAIAGAAGVRFLPLQRGFDYYGENAEEGVRISGGMGTFANNHFLGMMGRLRAEGMSNLLTGCYCDYLFKGLPLNRQSHWLTSKEKLAPFRHQFYFSHYLFDNPLAVPARERWEARIPTELTAQDSAANVFEIEARRTFPLCYEGDNQQRVVPQRISGWSPPIVDREILEVYRKVPFHYKLNRLVFSQAVLRLCDDRLTRIPDANTGVRVGASAVKEVISSNWLRARRKLRGIRPSISSDGSWPDWYYYVAHSRKLQELWRSPKPEALDFFHRLLGAESVLSDVSQYSGKMAFQFVSLLTLKLWWDQRW